jgi:aminoglycoside phosphotransferase (APT) family kinase protein
MGGYRRLLKDSGIPATFFFCPLPDYRYPRRVSNLEPATNYPLDDNTISRWKRPFVYSFSIVAGKSVGRENGFQELIETLRQSLRKTSLACTRYLIQKTDAILFLKDSEGQQYIARLPYGQREAGRSRSNAVALRLLKEHGGVSGVAIPEILLEERIGRDYVTVETMVPGSDLRKILRQGNSRTIQVALTDFLAAFGREHISRRADVGRSVAAASSLSETVGRHLLDRSLRSELTVLSRQLVTRLERAECATLWAHGDFNLGNCLWNTHTNGLQSLVDWDQMQEDGVPGWDLVQLIGSVRRHQSKRTIADSVGDIAMNELTAGEQALWDRYFTGLGVPHVELPVVLATVWLKVTAYGFLNSSRHLSRSWVERSIRPALSALTRRLAAA